MRTEDHIFACWAKYSCSPKKPNFGGCSCLEGKMSVDILIAGEHKYDDCTIRVYLKKKNSFVSSEAEVTATFPPFVFFHFWFHTSFTLFSRTGQRNSKFLQPGEQNRYSQYQYQTQILALIISRLCKDICREMLGIKTAEWKSCAPLLRSPSLPQRPIPGLILCSSVSKAAPLLIVHSLYRLFCSHTLFRL